MNKIYIAKYGEGFPLVCFHGWGFDHRIWLNLVAQMQTQYQLYLVDLPGFGLSSLLPWPEFKKIVLDQVPTQFALMGWSMGGLMATRLALEEPEYVSHLVNVASSPRFIKQDDWPGIEQAVFDNFFANLATNPQATLERFIRLQIGNNIYAPIQFTPQLAALKAGLEILARWDLREALSGFHKPTCFIFGQLDSIVPRSTFRVMQKMYPNFKQLMLAKSAHIPFLSHPKDFIQILQEFLR